MSCKYSQSVFGKVLSGLWSGRVRFCRCAETQRLEPKVEIWRQCFNHMMLWRRQIFPSCERPGGVVSACLLVIWDHAPSEIMRDFFLKGELRRCCWHYQEFRVAVGQLCAYPDSPNEMKHRLRMQAHTNGERQCYVNMLQSSQITQLGR